MRHPLDRPDRRSLGAPMARKVPRKDVPAVVAEIAALQRERGVVEPGAVNEDGASLRRVWLVSGGVGKAAFAVYRKLHSDFRCRLQGAVEVFDQILRILEAD